MRALLSVISRSLGPLSLGVALALAPVAAKADPNAAAVAVMADACSGCHGTDGQSVGAMPSFIGKDTAALKKMLLEYKTGGRDATVMDRIVKGYSDAQLEAISAYYGARKKQ